MKRTILFGMVSLGLLLAQQPLKHAEQQRRLLLREYFNLSLEIGILQKQLLPLQTAIDSLQKVRAKRSKIHAVQKKALSLSRHIVTLQSKSDSLNHRIKTLNALLFKRYSEQIDLLRQKLSTVRSGKTKNALAKKLNHLYEQRLHVSPELKNLPFDLRKLTKINPNEINDSLQKAILNDYLQRALQAINTQDRYLQLKSDALYRMQRLREKTRTFMSEVNGPPMNAPMAVKEGVNNKPMVQNVGRGEIASSNRLPLALDLARIDRLIQQALTTNSRVSTDSVLKAIKQTRKILDQYRRIIQAKLKK